MRRLVIAFLAVSLLGCRPSEPAMPSIDIDQVRADLEVISGARVFFGHQSVGRDLLAGIQALSKEAGVPLPITAVEPGTSSAGKGLFHANVGRNREPDLKLADFMAAAGDTTQPFDLALLKFCYVDLGEESREKSPGKLFEQYRRDMSRLKEGHPKLAVLHATMPLMSDPPGWKTTVKRWLGRPTWRDDAHRRRAEYNEQIRASFSPDHVFDIARLESTRIQGDRSSFSVGGKIIETMAAEYTHDGGHLNELANRQIAAGFLRALAMTLTARSDG